MKRAGNKERLMPWLGEGDGKQETDIPIGKALRLLRTNVGINQSEAGRREGAPDFRTISHWETNRKLPSMKLLIPYLRSLGCDLHDLQDALDQVTAKPNRFTDRLVSMERRLSALERWRESIDEDH